VVRVCLSNVSNVDVISSIQHRNNVLQYGAVLFNSGDPPVNP